MRKFSDFLERLRKPHIDIQVAINKFIDPEVYPFHPYLRPLSNNILYEIQLETDEWEILYNNWFKR
jgi:hypothetical protein